jgi:hypothetical protein
VRWRLLIDRHLGCTAPDGADRLGRFDRGYNFDRNEHLHDRDEHDVDRGGNIHRRVLIVGRRGRLQRHVGLVGKLRHRRVTLRLFLQRCRQR